MTNSKPHGEHNFLAWRCFTGYAWLAGLLIAALSTASLGDGLSLAQQAQARTVATTANWPATATSRRLHPLGLQTLSVEKQERKNQAAVRYAHVYQYHYVHRQARLLVVDLDRASIAKQRLINSVHLPLNASEIAHAQSLILQDATVLQQLHAEQHHRGQPPTVDLSDIDVKASIFEPLDPAHDCHTQRCALMSLFDQSRTVFAVEPVVLLDTQRVRLLGQP